MLSIVAPVLSHLDMQHITRRPGAVTEAVRKWGQRVLTADMVGRPL